MLSKIKKAYRKYKQQEFQKKYNLVNSEWVKMYSERWMDLRIVELTPMDLAKMQMSEIVKCGTLDIWYKHCLNYRKKLKNERVA